MRPSIQQLFEIYAAKELGHTIEYIREQRRPGLEGYYNEYINPLWRAWNMSWKTQGELRDGLWNNYLPDNEEDQDQ